MNERDKILQRILNLRARAEDDGSSEAEAMAAIAKAQRLMHSYRVAEAELSLAEAEGRIKVDIVEQAASRKHQRGRGARRHKVIFVMNAIEEATCTKMVLKRHSGIIKITGDRPDVEMADYLVTVCHDALDREYDAYRRSAGIVGRGAKASFQYAMAERLAARLYDMARHDRHHREREAHEARKRLEDKSTSTALVLADAFAEKEREVQSAFATRYPKLGSIRVNTTVNNGSAYTAGREAGDRVNLGRAVEGDEKKALR